MDLFGFDEQKTHNLLPYDGEVYYYGPVFDKVAADAYYHALLENIAWQHDQAIILGKKITTTRKVAWYGDKPFSYTYSKVQKTALPWNEALLDIKSQIEETCQESFNSCLLNLYQDGSQGMAWHSDGEKDLKKHGAIASVSFGAERLFAFKHKTSQEKVSLPLAHGSLLIMQGATQDNWLHRLPPSKKIHAARINLTFRNIVSQ